MTPRIAVLPGDGIGPEVTAQAVRVLTALSAEFPHELVWAPVGVAAYRETGTPLPAATLERARAADAVLFGAVGDARYDHLGSKLRPDAAIGGLRLGLELFVSFRHIRVPAGLTAISPLKSHLVEDVDVLVVREIGGDVYFGAPKGQRVASDGQFVGDSEGFDTMRYTESEVRRVARRAFEVARQRKRRVVSADKANVLATSRLWRRVLDQTAREFPDVELKHLYADNVAMMLVTQPRVFDVVVTANLFGDILSDVATVLTGSIGLTASAMFNERGLGFYEPGHGTALDIAGRDTANPVASIRTAALMLRHSFGRADLADRIESAIEYVLVQGCRTADIWTPGSRKVGTHEMGSEVLSALTRTR